MTLFRQVFPLLIDAVPDDRDRMRHDVEQRLIEAGVVAKGRSYRLDLRRPSRHFRRHQHHDHRPRRRTQPTATGTSVLPINGIINLSSEEIMPLVSLRQLLDHAAENGYGLPAFNVNNMEQVLRHHGRRRRT